MLRVKSFAITDDAGINELLTKHRLAKGASILVSNGHVCIPFEDGQPMNKEQRIVAIGEEKNLHIEQLALLEHSQKVVDLQIADAENRFNVAQEAYHSNKVTKDEKKLEAERNRAGDALTEAKNLNLSNTHEIVRIKRNIELFDEAIAALK